MKTTSVTIDESDRQAILLALAELALSRPGWDLYLGDIAQNLSGRALFHQFKTTSGPLPHEPAKAKEELLNWTKENGRGTNFHCLLYSLIAKADPENIRRLRKGFPAQVRAFEEWLAQCPL